MDLDAAPDTGPDTGAPTASRPAPSRHINGNQNLVFLHCCVVHPDEEIIQTHFAHPCATRYLRPAVESQRGHSQISGRRAVAQIAADGGSVADPRRTQARRGFRQKSPAWVVADEERRLDVAHRHPRLNAKPSIVFGEVDKTQSACIHEASDLYRLLHQQVRPARDQTAPTWSFSQKPYGIIHLARPGIIHGPEFSIHRAPPTSVLPVASPLLLRPCPRIRHSFPKSARSSAVSTANSSLRACKYTGRIP